MVTTTSLRIPLEALVEQSLITRKITHSTQYQLMLLLLAEGVNEEDHILVDRLLYGVRRGLLRLDRR